MNYKELMGYKKTKSNKVIDNIKEEFGYVNEGPAYEYEKFSKSIEKAIESASPEHMLELKKAEQAFEIQMKELEVDVFRLEAEDKQNARATFSKDWTTKLMGILTLSGFMGYIFLVTLQPPEQNSEALINLVLGYLGGLASAVISFYFGASQSKDD